MKPKSEYTKEEYTAEVIALWEDVVRTVYLKEPTAAKAMAEDAWEGTNMTPIRYVVFVADPTNLTNQILRGQKAREKRWASWMEARGQNVKD